MSELPEGISPGEVPVPADSASGIVLRRGGDGRAEVLLGRRARTSSFMPGHEVFPGGVIEALDEPASSGALARCVAREVQEETGLGIRPEDWIDAGERTTPPMFPRRFRNRFFVTLLDGPAGRQAPEPATAEFEQLAFCTPASALQQWEAGRVRLPPPLLPILRALEACSAGDPAGLARRVVEVNLLEEHAPRIEFIPGVWMLPLLTETLPPATHTNVWMPGAEAFVVIDPGSGDAGEQRRLEAVIERRRGLGATPLAVVLTHRHRDHTAGALNLARRLDVPLRADASVLQALVAHVDRAAPLPQRVPLADGDQIELGGMTLQAMHTPGHAPGHLAFRLPELNALIAGDLVSGLSTILIDPQLGDMGAYLDSLRRMRDLATKLLLPGHGPPLPGRALDRLIGHREEREQRLLAQVGSGPTALADIARGAYHDAPRMPAALTERQALAHLIHLERRGRVRALDATRASWARNGEV